MGPVCRRELTHASLVKQVDKLGSGLEGSAHAPQAQALHVSQVGGLCRASRGHVQHTRIGQAALDLDHSLHTTPAELKDFALVMTGALRT